VTWSDGRRGAGTRHTDGTMYKTCISGVIYPKTWRDRRDNYLTRQTGQVVNQADGTDGTDGTIFLTRQTEQ